MGCARASLCSAQSACEPYRRECGKGRLQSLSSFPSDRQSAALNEQQSRCDDSLVRHSARHGNLPGLKELFWCDRASIDDDELALSTVLFSINVLYSRSYSAGEAAVYLCAVRRAKADLRLYHSSTTELS
ncbi:uncharacterized protein L969DRAFT_95416 [Mixia osmundae IAM 14324]|uniref:Uncharacterized protein n=1 Tax=Mixia osmundae (strain CBS 9802 / IAM 14324 / JCM 22182 / KY 12970) TaxID=764103 RepID=G7E0F8_MIXOS|nr:uncharacterized protein L969DRAFT_95416 [Mixia osmundae IAM 14324]KEI38327.1 hypothetical protein L969DRAFT_95416 [Mixia osmundae IAM 14324]GAA96318.1 hypothetical protein E5Q_02984 [Mixia osmundae IAM 14324]